MAVNRGRLIVERRENRSLVDVPMIRLKTTPDDELYEERCAIRQYDAGLSRSDAEILARLDMADANSPDNA